MMEKYLQSLEGISYTDWIKLRTGIDREFEHQKGESEKQLKLANIDEVERVISKFDDVHFSKARKSKLVFENNILKRVPI